ncbi:ABZJ_00895 family protein [Pseudovibrio sp. POLY-S9]|uniref:ABZJ_00895 family protein n=1 Tax=Pseudovibrio sp. POLY-S9 TaxID=1576596 RepID=UPI000B33EDBF|nr:ABZJ_00895 family protein [Pseudovibrio sp. POLY-S9]
MQSVVILIGCFLDTLQISLFRYAGRFAAIFVFVKVLLFVVLLIALHFFEAEIPLSHAAFAMPVLIAMLLGQGLFKREGARLIGPELHKLTALCFLIVLSIDVPLAYLAFPEFEGLAGVMGVMIGFGLFFSFLGYWAIFIGFKIGFRLAEKEAARKLVS